MRLMRTPKKMDIDITNCCNLRCRYCYHFESAGDAGGDLPAVDWIEFFEELNRCAVTEVTLAGGEPFVREDLREILGGIVKKRGDHLVFVAPVVAHQSRHRHQVRYIGDIRTFPSLFGMEFIRQGERLHHSLR